MSGLKAALVRLNDLHAEKLRFLGVGIWNTVFNMALFNVLLLVFGHARYMVWFWVAWVLSVGQSTVTMKYVAFRSKGKLLPQIARAFMIYLPAQGIATALMWFAVEVAHLPPQIGQLLTISVTTVLSYLGHKYFTFRVPLEVGEVPPESLMEGPENSAL